MVLGEDACSGRSDQHVRRVYVAGSYVRGWSAEVVGAASCRRRWFAAGERPWPSSLPWSCPLGAWRRSPVEVLALAHRSSGHSRWQVGAGVAVIAVVVVMRSTAVRRACSRRAGRFVSWVTVAADPDRPLTRLACCSTWRASASSRGFAVVRPAARTPGSRATSWVEGVRRPLDPQRRSGRLAARRRRLRSRGCSVIV